MPAGVPVATVGIGNAKNAGILAARIIASGNDEFSKEIQNQLEKFQEALRSEAADKGDNLVARIKNLVYPDR
jgi:5-(carboxyamino)imidazole ribonucleotide mutase